MTGDKTDWRQKTDDKNDTNWLITTMTEDKNKTDDK